MSRMNLVHKTRGLKKTCTMLTPYAEFHYKDSETGVVHIVRTAKRSFWRIRSKYMPHQGARECARRAAR